MVFQLRLVSKTTLRKQEGHCEEHATKQSMLITFLIVSLCL